MDGQGSDEYFCGYDGYFTIYMQQLLRSGKFQKAWKNFTLKAKFQKQHTLANPLIPEIFRGISTDQNDQENDWPERVSLAFETWQSYSEKKALI